MVIRSELDSTSDPDHLRQRNEDGHEILVGLDEARNSLECGGVGRLFTIGFRWKPLWGRIKRAFSGWVVDCSIFDH